MKTLREFGLIILTIFVLSSPAQAQNVSDNNNAGQSKTDGNAEVQRVLEQLSAAGSSEQDLNALIAELGDLQIRQIFLWVLRERLDEQTVEPQSTPLMARIESKLEPVRDNLLNTITALPRIIDIPVFLFNSFNEGRGSLHFVFVIVALLAIYLVAYIAERLVDALLRKSLAKSSKDAPRSRINALVTQCNSLLSNIVPL